MKKFTKQIILAAIFAVVGIVAVMSDGGSSSQQSRSAQPSSNHKPYSGISF